LTDKGQLDEAIAAYHRAISLMPGYAPAQANLGNALRAKGQLDEAAAACRRAIALNPDLPEAHGNLGSVLRDQGKLDEAIAAYRQALVVHPGYAEGHGNLGTALREKGQLDDGLVELHRAIALKPRFAVAYVNLGNTLRDKGQHHEAIAAYRAAIGLDENLAGAYSNLGNALRDLGQLDEAVAACRQAIALDANFADARNNLGNALKAQGELDEAIAAYRQAIALRPGYVDAHGNLLFTILYHPDYDARKIAEENRAWNLQHAARPRRFTEHRNDPSPRRRLRIGYVSPDFRDHAVGRNILPLFRHHDHGEFEITCYAQTACPDAMTAEFQQNADRWRDIAGLSDDDLAQKIRGDSIDILVDLALHTDKNRLLVFARKPAPVQATFAGYPGSTGLTAIDYRLSDPYLDPAGIDESVYSERTIRLPDSFWCYDPLDCGDIAVNPLPALRGGAVTFGCLNNFCKINDGVLALWARVMREVESSRLLLLAPPGGHRARMLERFTEAGIDPRRIEFVAYQSRRKYMETYHRIELGLDTFPYNGHTTSLDSFWMGVPVVTLIGSRAVARAGWCQLSNLGLAELAGETPEQFVRVAAELAKDLPRLGELRATLRRRMEQSPLMDARKFARSIEAAYRGMWRTWCESVARGS
jgi:predicted O-linked N-acetylglucosamine transferase (SPINDLY family)